MVSFLKTNILPDKDFQRAYYEFANNSQHIEQLLKVINVGNNNQYQIWQELYTFLGNRECLLAQT